MSVLRSIWLVVLAACYAPDVRDCTLACNATSDCVAGQICGEDRLCAAPAVAGTCLVPDAGPRDAAPPTAATSELEVAIQGKGAVVVVGHGMCDWQAPQDGYCAYPVPRAVDITLQAITADGYAFDHWTSACLGSTETCTVAPETSYTLAVVYFRKGHDN